jgi:hypothetical protein
VCGSPFLESSLDDSHRNVLHNGSSGGDGGGARANARQHERVPAYESLQHQILRLLPDVREQRRPADAGQQGRTLLLGRHRKKLTTKHQLECGTTLTPDYAVELLELEATKCDDRASVGKRAASPTELEGGGIAASDGAEREDGRGGGAGAVVKVPKGAQRETLPPPRRWGGWPPLGVHVYVACW